MVSKLRTYAQRQPSLPIALAALVVAAVVLITAMTVNRSGSGQPVSLDSSGPTSSASSPTYAPPSTSAPAAATPEPATSAASEAPSETGQPPVEPTPPVAAPRTTAQVAAPAPAPPAPVPTDTPAPAPAGPVGQSLPLGYDGGAGQVVTVAAPSWGATSATVTAWNRNGDGSWSAAVGPVQARIGAEGIGQAREGSARTPAGTYSLTQAFGRAGNPGTSLSYFQTGPSDWWDENPDSPTYNQHVVQADSPGGDSENLYYSGAVYNYAINIDHNTGGAPGAGSAFFLHVTNGAATAGCVAIPQGSLVEILQWISPGAVIVLGVG